MWLYSSSVHVLIHTSGAFEAAAGGGWCLLCEPGSEFREGVRRSYEGKIL